MFWIYELFYHDTNEYIQEHGLLIVIWIKMFGFFIQYWSFWLKVIKRIGVSKYLPEILMMMEYDFYSVRKKVTVVLIWAILYLCNPVIRPSLL